LATLDHLVTAEGLLSGAVAVAVLAQRPPRHKLAARVALVLLWDQQRVTPVAGVEVHNQEQLPAVVVVRVLVVVPERLQMRIRVRVAGEAFRAVQAATAAPVSLLLGWWCKWLTSRK